MPLCHWPCSCDPHHGLEGLDNEIDLRWVAAHGVLIVAPVNWYRVSGGSRR
jgi:multimeric flavodoxin WrbA